MYTITRAEWAESLNVSVRTLDRYIKNKKIRSKKIWKNVMLHKLDIDSILWDWEKTNYEIHSSSDNLNSNSNPNIIINSSDSSSNNSKKDLDIYEESNLDNLESLENNNINYKILYSEIKDFSNNQNVTIQKLSYKLWKLETELRNSVPMLEYKKTSFLLEWSKTEQKKNLEHLEKRVKSYNERIKQEKFVSTLLVICVVILLILFGVLAYLYIFSV